MVEAWCWSTNTTGKKFETFKTVICHIVVSIEFSHHVLVFSIVMRVYVAGQAKSIFRWDRMLDIVVPGCADGWFVFSGVVWNFRVEACCLE